MEKRKSENQLTKDSVPTEEGEEVTHGFEKASEEVLKTRKICKVKRAVTGGNAPSSSNPFAGIALKVTNGSTQDSPKNQQQQDDTKEQQQQQNGTSKKASTGGGFGGLAKGGGGFGGLAFGKGSSAASTGLAFGGASTAKEESVLPVFGSSKASQTQDGEEAVTTGEEEEDTLYSCAASLYEFDKGQWKEKGKGMLKLNKHKVKAAIRLIMRQQGNLKLMLNAHVWDGMKINTMEESKGISFSCINHLTDDDSKKTLGMFAIRARDATAIQGLCQALDAHRKKPAC